jgi:hypothetical protein
VLSSDPETACRPSLLNATAYTQSVCPWSSCKQVPVWRSHHRRLLSYDPESMSAVAAQRRGIDRANVSVGLVQAGACLEVPPP